MLVIITSHTIYFQHCSLRFRARLIACCACELSRVSVTNTGDNQHGAPAAYGGDHDAKVIGDPLTMESPGDGERLIPGHGDAAQLSKVSLIHNIFPKRQGNQLRRNWTKKGFG